MSGAAILSIDAAVEGDALKLTEEHGDNKPLAPARFVGWEFTMQKSTLQRPTRLNRCFMTRPIQP